METELQHGTGEHSGAATCSAFICCKCRNAFSEIGRKQHRDGDVSQWCPKCGASDDHIEDVIGLLESARGLVSFALQASCSKGQIDDAINWDDRVSKILDMPNKGF